MWIQEHARIKIMPQSWHFSYLISEKVMKCDKYNDQFEAYAFGSTTEDQPSI
jgi:hypothetical protein